MQLSVRKIIHIDMDAFYPSVEERDTPELKGKPVIVGGPPSSRGVVCSASYEARKFGVHSAMSCAAAERLCPHGIFITPNFEKYLTVSKQIRAIFQSVTTLVEPLALDEAYLDVTSNLLGEPIATKLALHIKQRIQSELNLTASAGVGPNKFIAKLASDLQKPNGLVVIPPEKVFAFIENLPDEQFWGVGPATTKKLHALGIKTAKEIRETPLHRLQQVMGKSAPFLLDLAHGKDLRAVTPHREAKSKASETTFEKDVSDIELLSKTLEMQAEEVGTELRKAHLLARTVTLKLRYPNFKTITRSRTFFKPTQDPPLIAKASIDLLLSLAPEAPIRLIGLAVSNLLSENSSMQLTFDF
jgi:DNA polymerase-4